MRAAIDFGITNTDLVFSASSDSHLEVFSSPSSVSPIQEQLSRALQAAGHSIQDFSEIAVTGGQSHRLPSAIGTTRIFQVKEVQAIGRGGLLLSGLDEAIIVSAGSGTALVSARRDQFRHATGSAVGGGTLQGLCRALIGTADPQEINTLALQGDANAIDLTLFEATGGSIASLPADANAVNFGRLARQPLSPSREDLAAATVRLVAQVIAVIAINAAHAEHLESIVFIGRLVVLPSIRQVLETVAGYYGAHFTFPENPGSGTVLGALHGFPTAEDQTLP